MASRLSRFFLSLGFVLSVGFAFGALSLAGCGSSQQVAFAPANERAWGDPDGEKMPEQVAQRLEGCQRQGSSRLRRIEHTVRLHVYVNNEGQGVSAYLEASTLGDHETEACLVSALRTAWWPTAEVAAQTTAPAPQSFMAMQAEPAPLPVEPGPVSGIRPTQPPAEPIPPPRTFQWRFPPPALVGPIVFITVFLWPNELAPPWLSELNPITRGPYLSRDEYDAIRKLPPAEIERRRKEHGPTGADPNPSATGQPVPPPGEAAAPEGAKDPRPEKCKKAEPAPPVFTADMFKFVVTMQYDEKDGGGGWQEAKVKLPFIRSKPLGKSKGEDECASEAWVCPVVVGIPIRTRTASFSTSKAAETAAEKGNEAATQVKRSPEELEADFCRRFRVKMQALIGFGARVSLYEALNR